MKHLFAGALAACMLAAMAGPALGDDSGTVAAQVSVAAPCITVTPAQLDFGTLGLSQSAASPTTGSRALGVENCGAGSQNVLARGTNAASTGGAAWTLEPNQGDLCSTPNRFTQRIDTGPLSIPLSVQNAPIAPVAGGQTASWNALLVMPCSGSDGAGQAMTFSYVFTAVLA